MDGYYFTIASKTTVNPNSGISSTDGWNAVLWYQNFKSGGKNDGEIPQFNVQLAPIYPFGAAPPENDPATIQNDSGHAKVVFTDGTSITGSLAFRGIEIGNAAGSIVKAKDGSDPVTYEVFRGDGRNFYTDADGYVYRCMHYARNPIIIG